jgi:hypothetical protein
MRPMWMRRLLSAVIVAILTAATALLDIEGLAAYFAFGATVLVAMLAGIAAEPWLKQRWHRSHG